MPRPRKIIKMKTDSTETKDAAGADSSPSLGSVTRFTMDTESGFVWDAEQEEWLTTAEEVFLAMSDQSPNAIASGTSGASWLNATVRHLFYAIPRKTIRKIGTNHDPANSHI
jgi:hypothetical protein